MFFWRMKLPPIRGHRMAVLEWRRRVLRPASRQTHGMPGYKASTDLARSAANHQRRQDRDGDRSQMQKTKAAEASAARAPEDIRVQQAFLARVLGEIEAAVGGGKDRRLAIRQAAAKLAEARLDWKGMATAVLRA